MFILDSARTTYLFRFQREKTIPIGYTTAFIIIIIIIIGVFWAQDAVILCVQIIALEVEFLFEVIFCWLITPELV